MSDVFTIFYSWQSDTSSEHGRNLVREAFDIAADTIGKEPGASFRLQVLSDTENESGLCNIPQTVLRRLRESDAIVSDLTFVARTGTERPKFCSNPNVLFELGYAYGQIGPERLVCVMNVAHGPVENQIFDLAQHRHPITYCSPQSGVDRAETVRNLAQALETELRKVVRLGLVGSAGGDDEVHHQRQQSEIETYWHSVPRRKQQSPYFIFRIRPRLFRAKRWPDAEVLERVLREVSPLEDRYLYPPQKVGTAPMDWGLYNDTYGDPWALTYAGQFWTQIAVGGYQEYSISEHDSRVSPEPPESLTLQPDQWVSMKNTFKELSIIFQFARNLTSRFSDHEEFHLEFYAKNVQRRWLVMPHWETGPCKAPHLHREFKFNAQEFHVTWREIFADLGKDFCDLFCRDGRVIGREAIATFLPST